MPRVKCLPEIKPAEVIASFLSAMTAAAERTFPMWNKLYLDGLVDVAPEGSPLYDQLAAHQPIDDFYYAGVVAYEAAKIRRYLDPDNASQLLSELAAQVDHAARRSDRTVSDLVFFIMGRIELESGAELMTMPYDKVVQIILQRIGLEQHDSTKPLMNDFAYRHGLGEPLARGIPAWWKNYAAQIKRAAVASNHSGNIGIAAE